jgi:phage-related minor tail protein
MITKRRPESEQPAPVERVADHCAAIEQQLRDTGVALTATRADLEKATTVEDLAKTRSQVDFLEIRCKALLTQRMDLEYDRLKEAASDAADAYRRANRFAELRTQRERLATQLDAVDREIEGARIEAEELQRAIHAAQHAVALFTSSSAGDPQRLEQYLYGLRTRLEQLCG